MRNGRALGLYLVLAVVVIILDQLSKIWIVSAFDLYQRMEILPFFNLVYVRNTGAAFSFLSDAGGWQRWFFTAIAVAVGVILVRWLKKVAGQQPVPAWGCALVLGGAIGNLIDRLQHGFVIDFLDVHAAGYHWPAFNIADSAICIGAALLILDGFVSGKRDAKARASSTKES